MSPWECHTPTPLDRRLRGWGDHRLRAVYDGDHRPTFQDDNGLTGFP